MLPLLQAAEQEAAASEHLLDRAFLGNSLTRWIVAAAVFVAVLVVLRVLKSVIISRIKKWAEKTQTRLDDLAVELVARTKGFFLFLMAAFAASHSLELDPRVAKVFHTIVVIGVGLQACIWAGHVVTFTIVTLLERKGEEDSSRKALANVFGFLGRLAVWSVILLLALANMGVDVSTAIAGLGVGGIAIALALQNILGDLFASLTIILDKPFEIGDAIVIGDFTGTVEEIGLKSTRLRSVGGEQIIVSNGDLLASRIRNFKRMQQRRIVFSLGVTYETPPAKLEQIPDLVRKVVSAVPNCSYGRAHLKTLADSALQYEVAYLLNSPDYDQYMDAQQRINLALLQRFSDEGIEFAYPTQTLWLRPNAAAPPR